MRTSKMRLEIFLTLDPDQLRSVPPRIMRDWLLDLQDAVVMVDATLREYAEEKMASTLGGTKTKAPDVISIDEFLGDHASVDLHEAMAMRSDQKAARAIAEGFEFEIVHQDPSIHSTPINRPMLRRKR